MHRSVHSLALSACLASPLAVAACADDPIESAGAISSDTTAAERAASEPPLDVHDPLGGLRIVDPDGRCQPCHEEVAESFLESGMRRSLARTEPASEIAMAAVASGAVGPGDGLSALLRVRDGVLVQAIPHPLFPERELHAAELPIAVGSGRAARSWLHAADGRLFQSAVTWYRDLDGAEISPGGFFRTESLRPADDLCIGCHTGRLTTTGAGERRRFEGELSPGIGCDRCHGEGAAHTESGDPLHVVNPARLSIERQADVCSQCHMSGALELSRPGTTLAAYRPGTPLADVYGVFAAADGAESETPSIAGHVSALQASRCFESSEAMTCTTCHDPHAHGEDAGLLNAGCNACHENDDCGTPERERIGKNCAGCHMPLVTSSDVAHTRTTDHRIRVLRGPLPEAPPPEETFVGALAVANRELVNLLDPAGVAPGSDVLLGAAYVEGVDLALSVLGQPAPGYVERASALLEPLDAPDADADVLLLIGRLRLLSGDAEGAVSVLDRALAARPGWAAALAERAFALRARDGAAAAAEAFEAAWNADGYSSSVAAGAAHALAEAERPDDALALLAVTRRRLGPGLERAQVGMRIAWKSGKVQDALVLWFDQVAFLPRDPVTLIAAAEACAYVDRLDDALALAERVEEIAPEHPDLQSLLQRLR